VPAGLVLALTAPPSSSASTSATLSYVPASIDPSLPPDSTTYDASDERLRRAGRLIQEALNAPTVEDEERTWTRIIEEFSGVEAVWRDDVVGRAYGNRGNARSRQGKVDEALKDYDESIRICPWSVDPVLVCSGWLGGGGSVHTLTHAVLTLTLMHAHAQNRGVLFENQLLFDEAIADYRAVLKVSPSDPVAWNNLGNALMGSEKFEEAIKAFDKAVKLGGNNYAFAMANKSICLYANGDDQEAEREMMSLLRRFPNFAEVRASLGSLQWIKGEREKAEENWLRVNEPRYRDVRWLRKSRRWPKRLADAAEKYLSLSS